MEPKEIRQVREALGLTSKEMSRGLNVNYQSLDRWEDGSNRPIGIQEAVYDALYVVVGRVSADGARAIGAQLRLGFGSLLVNLILQSVREVEVEEVGAFRSLEPVVPSEEPAPKTEPSPKSTKARPAVKKSAKKAKSA